MMEEFEVAVTVFATVRGVDARDASRRLEALVRHRFLWDGHGYYVPNDAGTDAPVHTVMEAGVAVANGYLWPRVTRQAYRESSHHACTHDARSRPTEGD